MNIEKVFEDQMALLKVPPHDWESLFPNECDQVARETAMRAAEAVSDLRARVLAERDLIRRWIAAAQSRDTGQKIPEMEGEASPMFSIDYYHHGDLEGDQRVGLGLTSVYETDWNITGGHKYPLRMELGWHRPGMPLSEGMFYRDGYSRFDDNFGALRSIDPETLAQTGIWIRRKGGSKLCDWPVDIAARPENTRVFVGSFERGSDGRFDGTGVAFNESSVEPVVDGVIGIRPGFEHLLGFDYLGDRMRTAAARGGGI